jgi:hypothetical protein
MQADAFGWAVNEASGSRKTEKQVQKSKVLCPRLACVTGLPFRLAFFAE